MITGPRDTVIRARKLRSFFAIFALALSALSVGCAYQTGYLPIRLFDSAEWKSASYWDGTRVEMIEHLLWSKRLDGLDKGAVISLLGPDPETTYFSEHDLVYPLGPERGLMSLDSEWLIIDFDDEGVVESYQVMGD
ncbi:hypothetical protein [Pontixanthobacter aquaemixtae]|uniref:Outer membrane protein assembly factor BamE n=1 Tax=Pontixanthobacter aquaemixtae TaxID=1958940 RepID=A0A844ZRF0_9SPHN|nr:hypothetical protein [Pontixanthobacter aquaemixtae]MXO90413.1 hypothetical protein [Pontixanthobacter aquaemixtae]